MLYKHGGIYSVTSETIKKILSIIVGIFLVGIAIWFLFNFLPSDKRADVYAGYQDIVSETPTELFEGME